MSNQATKPGGSSAATELRKQRVRAVNELKREMSDARQSIEQRQERRAFAYSSQPGAIAAAAGKAKSNPGAKLPKPVRGVPAANSWQAANRSGKRPRATAAPWTGMADAFLTSQTHAALRNEARQAGRRFTLAQAMLARMCDLVISDGLIIKCTSKDTAYAAAANAHIKQFLKNPTMRGRGHTWTRVLHRVIRALGTDGDIGLVFNTLAKIEEIQSERIVNPGGIWAMDTDSCIGGVEVDSYGAPVAFNVQSRAAALTMYGGGDTTKVAAEDMFFVINPIGEDSGQTRGVPFLTWGITLIELLETYVEDQSIAAKIATLFGLIYKVAGNQNPASELDVDESATAQAGEPTRSQTFEPGYSLTIGPDESVEQVKPEYPQQNARDFATLVSMMATCSIGLPLILVLLDPSQTNFHGFKSAISVSFRMVNYMQELVSDITQWAIERSLAVEIRAGRLTQPEDWNALKIVCPPMPTPDFGKDVDAIGKAISLNLMDKSTGTQLLGTGDADEIAASREREVADEKAKGITPIIAGAGPNPADAEADPEEKPKDKKK